MTAGKKEKEKKKAQKRKEKEERRAERKQNNNKGKGLEAMMAYTDEEGNILTAPPDKKTRKELNLEDIVIGVAPRVEEPEDPIRNGTVSYYNAEKGFGFIIDSANREEIFVHQSNAEAPLKEKDKVVFEKEAGKKGPVAVRVRIATV